MSGRQFEIIVSLVWGLQRNSYDLPETSRGAVGSGRPLNLPLSRSDGCGAVERAMHHVNTYEIDAQAGGLSEVLGDPHALPRAWLHLR